MNAWSRPLPALRTASRTPVDEAMWRLKQQNNPAPLRQLVDAGGPLPAAALYAMGRYLVLHEPHAPETQGVLGRFVLAALEENPGEPNAALVAMDAFLSLDTRVQVAYLIAQREPELQARYDQWQARVQATKTPTVRPSVAVPTETPAGPRPHRLR